MQQTIDRADSIARPGRDVNLAGFDPAFKSDFNDKQDAKETLSADFVRLSALPDVSYADARYALLIMFGELDAAGKDGAIRYVMPGVDPHGMDGHAIATIPPRALPP